MEDKDALSYLVSLGQKPEQLEIEGRDYILHPAAGDGVSKLEPVIDPQIKALEVSTLEGLKNLIIAEFEGELVAYGSKADPKVENDEDKAAGVIVHVVGFNQVNLVTLNSDRWGRRDVVVSAKLPDVTGFKFGQYLDHEEFTIGLLSQFTPESKDRDYLLRISANLADEAVRNSEDDGITQVVSTRQGVAIKGTEQLRNRVTLAPFRTFREVAQPESDFVFRVKRDRDEGVPKLALFEADGGAWKLDAVENIADFFKYNIGEVKVVA